MYNLYGILSELNFTGAWSTGEKKITVPDKTYKYIFYYIQVIADIL